VITRFHLRNHPILKKQIERSGRSLVVIVSEIGNYLALNEHTRGVAGSKKAAILIEQET
jgi:hypothetical protein